MDWFEGEQESFNLWIEQLLLTVCARYWNMANNWVRRPLLPDSPVISRLADTALSGMRSILRKKKKSEYRLMNKEIWITKFTLQQSSFLVQYSPVLMSFLVQYSSVQMVISIDEQRNQNYEGHTSTIIIPCSIFIGSSVILSSIFIGLYGNIDWRTKKSELRSTHFNNHHSLFDIRLFFCHSITIFSLI